MSYKIQYSPETSSQYPQYRSNKPFNYKRWLTVAIAIVAVLWIHLYGVPDFLIPGNPEVTKTAASTLVDEIKNGATVGNAVTAFCKTILDGAEVSY